MSILSIENIISEKKSSASFSFKEIESCLFGYVKADELSFFHSISEIKDISSSPDKFSSSFSSSNNSIDCSTLNIPEFLSVRELRYKNIGHVGLFANCLIPKRTRLGIFTGRKVPFHLSYTITDKSYTWEIFDDYGRVDYIIDANGAPNNWLKYIAPARHQHEQNVDLFVDSFGNIVYETCKSIEPSCELLVWYRKDPFSLSCVNHFLKQNVDNSISKNNKLLISTTIVDKKTIVSTHLDNSQFENHEFLNENPGNYPCDRCGKVFTYAYYKEKHLKFTKCIDKGDRQFACTLCDRTFEKRDRLRIHILHVHDKHRPYICQICGKGFSQSSSLNKHQRVHNGERPYQCNHCGKRFTASSILRTHLRQHSGEKPFMCKYCGKSFASHAAHDSHVKRTHPSANSHNIVKTE